MANSVSRICCHTSRNMRRRLRKRIYSGKRTKNASDGLLRGEKRENRRPKDRDGPKNKGTTVTVMT